MLVVEDDLHACALTAATFGSDDWDVVQAHDIDEARTLLDGDRDVSMMLLDVDLPGGGGLEFLGQIRNDGHARLPVVIVSGCTETVDRVIGLRMGADDYVTKPFDPTELRARVDAVMRRSCPVLEELPTLEFGALRICPMARDVFLEGKLVTVSAAEFDLLLYLAQHPRQVFTRKQLLEQMGESAAWQASKKVTEHVRRLRAKLTTFDRNCLWIKTVHAVGYRFEPEARAS